MPPRVFMPIRRRRRASDNEEIDPLVKKMTHGSLMIGLGFVIILAGVLVTIFALKPKTARYRRPPKKTFIITGLNTQPPELVDNNDYFEEEQEGLNISLVLGPILALAGVGTAIAGAIFYAVTYQQKKRKDKQTRRTSDEETRDLTTPMDTSTSGTTINFPDVATSVSDAPLSLTNSRDTLGSTTTGV